MTSPRRLPASLNPIAEGLLHLPFAAVMTDGQRRVCYVNHGWEVLTGFQAAETIGRLSADFVDSIDHHYRETAIVPKLVGGNAVQTRFTFLRADGTRFRGEVAISPLHEAGESAWVLNVIRDVTEEEKAQAALVASKTEAERLARIADMTGNHVILTDQHFKIVWANHAFLAASGQNLADILGRTSMSITLGPLSDHTQLAEVRRLLAEGQAGARCEVQRVTKDGRYYWVEADIQALRDEQGKINGYVNVAFDITARKESEATIRRYAADLERFAHLASHDLQEPLRKIATHSTQLVKAVEADDKAEIERCVSVLIRSAQRGRGIVSDLLRYSKLQDRPVDRAPARLDHLVDDIVQQVAEPAAGTITVTVPPLTVHCDAALITQTLQNLIGNALKFRKKGTRAHIEISAAREADGTWVLTIADDGIGFEQDLKDRMFKPFERLVGKDEYAGTGIGLSLVKSIIEKHGWAIGAKGVPNVGSIFFIKIAAADVAREAA